MNLFTRGPMLNQQVAVAGWPGTISLHRSGGEYRGAILRSPSLGLNLRVPRQIILPAAAHVWPYSP